MDKLARTLLNFLVITVFIKTGNVFAKGINVDLQSTGSSWPIEIAVPLGFFAIFPTCLFLIGFFRYRSKREKQITLRTMAENGAQIPPEMFMEGQKDLNPIDRDRRRGLLFTLSSLGLLSFLLIIKTSVQGMWSIALIPLLLGIGYLISWKLAEKEK